eukprot:141955-Chlamydomonas_euryale.AAC.4
MSIGRSAANALSSHEDLGSPGAGHRMKLCATARSFVMKSVCPIWPGRVAVDASAGRGMLLWVPHPTGACSRRCLVCPGMLPWGKAKNITNEVQCFSAPNAHRRMSPALHDPTYARVEG